MREFLIWWAARLAELVPARLRGRDRHGDVLIADTDGSGTSYRLSARRNGREMALTPVAAANRLARRPAPRVVLRLQAGAVLERTLTLPLAAERMLGRVVSHEIDRLTPFAVHEVAWTATIDRRDRVARRLHIRLILLPRAAIAGVMAALSAAGAIPGAALVQRKDGGTWDLDLAPPGSVAVARGPGLQRVGLQACALLFVVAMLLPVVTQELALRQQDEAIARLRPAIAIADALRTRIAGQASGLDAISAETARTGQVLTLIATLTALLPDDTHLTALSVKQRTLSMSGRSASASRLIPILAADPALKGAEFAAPITRTDGARGDAFTIRAGFGS